MLYKTKFYWSSGKDQQQHAHGVACPITNSKHSTVSDALTPVDCQGYLVFSSLGSKTKSCKCLLMWVRVVLSLGSTNSRGFERIVLYMNNVGSICCPCWSGGRVSAVCLCCWYWPRAGCLQSVYTADTGERAGCQKDSWLRGWGGKRDNERLNVGRELKILLG